MSIWRTPHPYNLLTLLSTILSVACIATGFLSPYYHHQMHPSLHRDNEDQEWKVRFTILAAPTLALMHHILLFTVPIPSFSSSSYSIRGRNHTIVAEPKLAMLEKGGQKLLDGATRSSYNIIILVFLTVILVAASIVAFAIAALQGGDDDTWAMQELIAEGVMLFVQGIAVGAMFVAATADTNKATLCRLLSDTASAEDLEALMQGDDYRLVYDEDEAGITRAYLQAPSDEVVISQEVEMRRPETI